MVSKLFTVLTTLQAIAGSTSWPWFMECQSLVISSQFQVFFLMSMQSMSFWKLLKLNKYVNFSLDILRAWVTFKPGEQLTVLKHTITLVDDVFEIFTRQIGILFLAHPQWSYHASPVVHYTTVWKPLTL